MAVEPGGEGRGRSAGASRINEFENYVKLNKKVSPEVIG